MKLRHFLAPIVIAIGQSAYAQPVNDIIAELQSLGFSKIQVTRTLLGRIKVEAYSPKEERELVISKSGRILRESREFEDENGNGIHDGFEDFEDDEDERNHSSGSDLDGDGGSIQTEYDDDSEDIDSDSSDEDEDEDEEDDDDKEDESESDEDGN